MPLTFCLPSWCVCVWKGQFLKGRISIFKGKNVGRCYLWLFTLYKNIKIGKTVVKC